MIVKKDLSNAWSTATCRTRAQRRAHCALLIAGFLAIAQAASGITIPNSSSAPASIVTQDDAAMPGISAVAEGGLAAVPASARDIAKADATTVTTYRVIVRLGGDDDVLAALGAGLVTARPGTHEYSVSAAQLDALAAAGLEAVVAGGTTHVLTLPTETPASAALETGSSRLASGTINFPIADNDGTASYWRGRDTAVPADAIVTGLTYSARIDHAWVADLRIGLFSGEPAFEVVAWNRAGGSTDRGADDDSADDSDVFFASRSTGAFNGQPAAQWYGLIAADLANRDTGSIAWVEITVNWTRTVAPDLTVPGVRWTSASVTEGDGFFIEADVTNAGNGFAAASHVRAYLSTDGDYDPSGDYAIGEKSVPSIPGGSVAPIRWDLSGFPNLRNQATYPAWVLFVVDNRNEVSEANENNTFKTTNAITVTDRPAGRPDLTANNVHVSTATPTEGASLTITQTIRNAGTLAAPASHASLYLSLDGDTDVADDYSVGEKSVPSLSSGASVDVAWTLLLPDLGAEPYDVRPVVVVDSRNEVGNELDERNVFVSTTPLRVERRTPDIRVAPDRIDLRESGSLGHAADETDTLYLKTGDYTPAAAARLMATGDRDEVLVIQYHDAITSDTLAALRARGIEPLAAVPRHALTARVPAGAGLAGLPGVRWIGRLAPEQEISPLLAEATGTLLAIAELHAPQDRDATVAALAATGAELIRRTGFPVNELLVRCDASQLGAIAAIDGIAYVRPAPPAAFDAHAHFCPGAVTSTGLMLAPFVAHDDGWDGPGRGSVALTFFHVNDTPDLAGTTQERAEFLRAFAEWSRVVAVTFTPAASAGLDRSLDITFLSMDGPGNTLASCYYPNPSNPEPIAGDMSMDEDDTWRVGSDIDVFSVVTHEIGHGIGLNHSDAPTAVMAASYGGVRTGLTQDDIDGARSLYANAGGSGTSFTVYNDGNAPLNVTSISPASAAAWITLSPQAPFTVAPGGQQRVEVAADFTRAPAGESRSRLLVVSNDPDESPWPTGVEVIVTRVAPPCTLTVTPPRRDVAASGASSLTVDVTASASCPWTASASAPWLHVVSGASGTGNGRITYSVDANTSTSARSGSIVVGGGEHRVQQAGLACDASISPGSRTFTADGGAGRIDVTSGSGCAWTAVSSAAWVRITSSATGMGSGVVEYTTDPNSASAVRSATVEVADRTHSITQEARTSPPGGTTATAVFTKSTSEPVTSFAAFFGVPAGVTIRSVQAGPAISGWSCDTAINGDVAGLACDGSGQAALLTGAFAQVELSVESGAVQCSTLRFGCAVEGSQFLVDLAVVCPRLECAVTGGTPGDLYPDGAGDNVVDLRDFVICRKKVLGAVPWNDHDRAVADQHPGIVTCDRSSGADSWCPAPNGVLSFADCAAIRRAVLHALRFACDACTGVPFVADEQVPGDAFGAPNVVDITDSQRTLGASVGLATFDATTTTRLDVWPAQPTTAGLEVEGDGVLFISDVIQSLRTAVGLERLTWPQREVIVRLDEASAPIAAWSVTMQGWPAWAAIESVTATGCSEPDVDALADALAVTCVVDEDALFAPDASMTVLYRAMQPVDPAGIRPSVRLLDIDLEPAAGAVTLGP